VRTTLRTHTTLDTWPKDSPDQQHLNRMGEAEQVQKDSSPIFPPPSSTTTTTVRRRKFEIDHETDENEKGTAAPSKSLPNYVRVLLLLSLIPIMFYLPRALSLAGEQVQQKQHLLIYLWVVYAAILGSVFFHFKRKTITLDSFATQIMAWLIFSLGIYHLVDLPKMVELHLRKDVLYVWCSFTMIFNLAYFFVDNTDYKEAERKEKLKEEKKQKKEEERNKKKAEKRKKKLEKMMSPKTRMIVNTLIYVGLAAVTLYIGFWLYRHYQHLQQELKLADPSYHPDAEYGDSVTEPVEGRDY